MFLAFKIYACWFDIALIFHFTCILAFATYLYLIFVIPKYDIIKSDKIFLIKYLYLQILLFLHLYLITDYANDVDVMD
jgi:hypothetical protein